MSTSQGYVVRPHLKKRKEKSTDENTRLHFDRCTSFPKCFHFPNCPLFLSSHVDFIAFLTFYLFIFFLLFLVLKKKVTRAGEKNQSTCHTTTKTQLQHLLSTVGDVCEPGCWGTDEWIPVAHPPASLAEFMSCRFSGRPVSENTVESD